MRNLDRMDGGEVLETGRSAAEPVAFSGAFGLFQPARGGALDTVVVFASPWALEELCTTRKFWRIIAEKLADRGLASFRFDWPGTGDALDTADFSKGLEVWRAALIEAAQKARALSGAGKVVVIGQSFGAAVAAQTGPRIDGLEAMALLAPVISGRFYSRELAIWSNMVDADLGLTDAQRVKDGVAIASFRLQPEIAAELRKLDLTALAERPAPRCLVLARVDRPSDADFCAHLEKLGAEVRSEPFADYDKLISNPLLVRLPVEVGDRLVDWAAEIAGATPAANRPDESGRGGVLTGDGFVEEGVNFGRGGRLSGVLCRPDGLRRGAPVVFVSASYDRRIGWGRTTVDMARRLARDGIASLRFDIADAGDSPPNPGRPEEVLYTQAPQEDLGEALDFLDAAGLGRPVVAGRCSGAYIGFHGALEDARVCGAVLANPIAFYWAPGRSLSQLVRQSGRTLEDYGSRALRLDTFKRLLRGELDLVAIARNILRGVGGRVRALARKALRKRSPEGRAVYAAFGELKRRQVPVTVLYSAQDPGREHYNFYFDAAGGRTQGFENVAVTVIPDADHNLTPEHSRAVYLDAIRATALKAG